MERASERERAIAANYYSIVTGELDKAAQTFQEEIEAYPRDSEGYGGWAWSTAHRGDMKKPRSSPAKNCTLYRLM